MEQLGQSLVKQIDAHAEVIIVDDANNPTEIEGVQYYKMEQHGGAAAARNFGAKKAKGEWLIFLDDDVMVGSHWYAALVLALTNHNQCDMLWGAIAYESTSPYFPMRIVENHGAQWPMSAHMMIKSTVFQTVGGFDPLFADYHNEDTELAIRIASLGYHWSRLPRLQVTHRHDIWKGEELVASSKHAAVWPILRKKYPKTWNMFKVSTFGPILFPLDYLYMLFFPILVFPLFIRYIFLNRNDPYSGFAIFFIKWPLWFILRRGWIWYESMRVNV